MKSRTFSRTMLAATLFAAIPFASVAATLTPAQSTALTHLQTRGAAEISRRITNLNAALTKLNASTKLTGADKTSLATQINNELTSLGALQTKLAADTDLATARTDVQSIVTDYRVYVLMLPKARLAASADRFAEVEDQLTTLATKLQTKIDTAKTAGKDTAAMQTTLNDLTAQVASAKTITDGLVAKLLALQPADYNTNPSILATYRQSLTTAHTDLKAARTDATTIITGLKPSK